MTKYVYSGTEVRYYPDLGITAEPGTAYEMESAPPDDGRWLTASEAAKKGAKPNA